ncbi:hypothetical protein LCGC14_2255770 [marine sediment metagenome]|uniref:Uncharacterized protein n=1 Tax=marine sediment metagenome TaxID=412755 RepID=A0A0F9D1K7_9ZZZZ
MNNILYKKEKAKVNKRYRVTNYQVDQTIETSALSELEACQKFHWFIGDCSVKELKGGKDERT